MRLTGTVALVTGASAGLGHAVARELVDREVQVLAHGRDATRTEATAHDMGATPLVADLRDPASRVALVAEALGVAGRVDVLVNNAGIGWSGPFTGMTVDDVRTIIDVDLVAQIELTRALLPGMVERGTGHVCFVSSIAGRTGVAGEAVYSAAKAGVDMFAESIAAELRGTGVDVSVVVPGVIDTGFFAARGRAYERRRPRPLPSATVARELVRSIERGRHETYVPRWLRVAPLARSMAPATFHRLSATFGEKVRIAPPSDGGTT